ncbi:hypothetical protein [Natrarchaeobaculum sulfurireducens]|uniref:Uncharacterized protein n=1 Tax=Natrarchaeobaculum sulfurireducens TaxID=2044521 RepID=A0A346PJG3_9EURY|nr:hypothetical protein [Natrarchaeobaculum sulfurireducens]AXR79658.1 hypothetical protein AArc1_3360 [Natrarchaeobaculum sulfurireducens]AXR83401.1 hypothetical protein AArcMg_3422 [Natrarchaeobaculum sulfurireducens]
MLSTDQDSNAGDDQPTDSDEPDSDSNSDDLDNVGEGAGSDDDPADGPTDDPAGDESGNDGSASSDDSSEPTESRIQVVADPTNDGTLLAQLGWDGRMTASDLVAADGDGFLAGFTLENVNPNAVSRIGTVGGNGDRDRPAFLVANIDDPSTPGTSGHTVEVSVTATNADGETVDVASQLRLPFRITVGTDQFDRGIDLYSRTIELPVGAVTEVGIEVDTRGETTALEQLANIEFVTEILT